MSDLALPPHLRGKLHNDWTWPLNKISRGWNAAGPRAPQGADDYMAWPPRLVEGKGVSRWENDGAQSILHIAALDKTTVRGHQVYGRTWLAVEMNPGRPDFMKAKDVYIPEWRPATVTDTPQQTCDPMQYSPSALQKFSPAGWMKLNPFYHSEWRVIKKRELPVYPETGDDTVAFFRRGNRPDHVDLYYNTDKFTPIGFVGLRWE